MGYLGFFSVHRQCWTESIYFFKPSVKATI